MEFWPSDELICLFTFWHIWLKYQPFCKVSSCNFQQHFLLQLVWVFLVQSFKWKHGITFKNNIVKLQRKIQESVSQTPIVSASKTEHVPPNLIVLPSKNLPKWSLTSMPIEKDEVSVPKESSTLIKLEFTFWPLVIVTMIAKVSCIISTQLLCISTSPLKTYLPTPIHRYICCNNHVFPHLLFRKGQISHNTLTLLVRSSWASVLNLFTSQVGASSTRLIS